MMEKETEKYSKKKRSLNCVSSTLCNSIFYRGIEIDIIVGEDWISLKASRCVENVIKIMFEFSYKQQNDAYWQGKWQKSAYVCLTQSVLSDKIRTHCQFVVKWG